MDAVARAGDREADELQLGPASLGLHARVPGRVDRIEEGPEVAQEILSTLR